MTHMRNHEGRTSVNAVRNFIESGSVEALFEGAFHGILVFLRIVFGGYGFLNVASGTHPWW